MVPVFAKGGFSDAPCSNYRNILFSCSYYMEDFDNRNILFDKGDIVQCIPGIEKLEMPKNFCSMWQTKQKLKLRPEIESQ